MKLAQTGWTMRFTQEVKNFTLTVTYMVYWLMISSCMISAL